MTVVVKFSRATYTFVIAIVGAFAADVLPIVPEYFPGFKAFCGAAIGALAAWLSTEEQEAPA